MKHSEYFNTFMGTLWDVLIKSYLESAVGCNYALITHTGAGLITVCSFLERSRMLLLAFL